MNSERSLWAFLFPIPVVQRSSQEYRALYGAGHNFPPFLFLLSVVPLSCYNNNKHVPLPCSQYTHNSASCPTGHTLNGQPLLEFSHAHDVGGAAGGAGSELRVKAATLWVRVDFRSPLHRAFRHSVPDKNLTLWVFTVTRQLQTNTTHLSGKVCYFGLSLI